MGTITAGRPFRYVQTAVKHIRGVELVATPALTEQPGSKALLLLAPTRLGNAEQAAAVAKLVAANNSIETVYLGCNYIEQEGCKAISEALKQAQA